MTVAYLVDTKSCSGGGFEGFYTLRCGIKSAGKLLLEARGLRWPVTLGPADSHEARDGPHRGSSYT